MFPAARKGDPITHDMLVPSGVIGPPTTGPCPKGVVMIEGLPAAHVLCTVVCTGAITGGLAHPPVPPPAPNPPITLGSTSVLIHGMPAARWAPSGDIGACGVFLGNPLLAAMRTVLIGGPSGGPSGAGVAALAMALALSLIDIRGTADATDAALVAQELTRFPLHVLQTLLNQGTRVAVCRGSVTEYRTELAGQPLRGWDPSATWDTVPGVYNPDRNEVTIATVGHGTPAGAHVPATGEGHGSANVVLHECGHALDEGGSGPDRSSSADFNTARNADSGTLSTYEGSQPGAAGQQETYAESAARYYGGDPSDASNHPNLHNYWASDPANPSP